MTDGGLRLPVYDPEVSPSDPSRASDRAEDPRAQDLRAQLALALEAAAKAEQQLGTVEGERQRATMEWAAASMAQAEWDVLLSETVEDLRLAREALGHAQAELEAHRSSRSWRLLQAVLGPYRWFRTR